MLSTSPSKLSAVNYLVEGLESYKGQVRHSMKSFCTEIQQSADKVTVELMTQLKQLVKAVRETDPDYRIVLTPEIRLSANDVAPLYEVKVTIKWYLFFVYDNRAYPLHDIEAYEHNEEAWAKLSNTFLLMLGDYGIDGTVWDLPSAQKVGTILGHKRFRENYVERREEEI